MENQETSPSGINVLIIHNEKKLLKQVKDCLEPMGYDVDVAHTGIPARIPGLNSKGYYFLRRGYFKLFLVVIFIFININDLSSKT